MQLKSLFLIQNKITKIENLSRFTQLTMLELGANRIRVREIIIFPKMTDKIFKHGSYFANYQTSLVSSDGLSTALIKLLLSCFVQPFFVSGDRGSGYVSNT